MSRLIKTSDFTSEAKQSYVDAFNEAQCNFITSPMFYQPGRIFASSRDEALRRIADKWGDGVISIRECNVQPRKDGIWFEYQVEVWPYG